MHKKNYQATPLMQFLAIVAASVILSGCSVGSTPEATQPTTLSPQPKPQPVSPGSTPGPQTSAAGTETLLAPSGGSPLGVEPLDHLATLKPAEVENEQTRQTQALGSKIVGGKDAPVGRYPWIVALGRLNEREAVISYCAGTVVDTQWILTAAHCHVSKRDVVVVGRYDLSTRAGRVIRVADVVPHPNFDPSTLDYDLALVKLEQDAGTGPIDLIDATEKNAQTKDLLWIAGWGRLAESDPAKPDKLQHVDVEVSDRTSCMSNYAGIPPPEGPRQVTKNMFCANKLNKDACKGDSGGPIVAFDEFNQTVALAGVISWGEGCAKAAYPGVYVRLSELGPWVKECKRDPAQTKCKQRS